MKKSSIALALSALLLAGACSDHAKGVASRATSDSTTATTVAQQNQLTPEQLGRLGAEIKKNPNDAQRLLSDHGLNEQTFAQAIRRVAEDPAASRRYADAYKKAGA